MAKQLLILFALLACVALLGQLQAQNCYNRYYAQAMERFEQKRFNEADSIFEIVLVCPDIDSVQREEVIHLRDEAKTGYIQVIEGLRDSLQRINLRKDDSLQRANGLLRHYLQACEEELSLEAQRLAFWAEQQSFNAAGEDALYLVYAALQLENDQPSPEVQRIFGTTAFEAYKHPLPELGAEVVEIQFSPVNNRFFTRLTNGEIEIWDMEGNQLGRIQPPRIEVNPVGKQLDSQRERFLDIIWSPDGESLLASTNQRKVISYDLKGRMKFEQAVQFGAITKIRFSQTGQYFLSCGRDGNVVVYQSNGDMVEMLRDQHDGPVIDAFFSPDGSKVLSRGSDGSANLWRLPEGELLQDLGRDHLYLYDAIFSPDGQYILTGGADKSIRLWNTDGRLLRTMEGHSGMVRQVQFSPDGRYILSRSTDQSARLWTLQGQEIATLRHNSLLFVANFSPDGQHIVTADKSGQALLWTSQGRRIGELAGHKDAVVDALFSPDGKQILTASQDGTAKLWDLQANLLMNMDGRGGPIQDATFDRTGSQIVLASKSQPPMIVPGPSLALQLLQANPPPPLSAEKKKRYGIP